MTTMDERQDVVLHSEALTTRFDPATRSLWLEMHALPRPCVTEGLLRQIQQTHRLLKTGEIDADFYVLASAVPEVFSLGGDLSVFRQCALTKDWARLEAYATLCIDVLHDIVSGFGRKVISIALIEGDALGGGFEAALATDFMVAEKGTRLGFPEVLFNLFPGMGAYSFLARKIGPQAAQRMILSGEVFQAEELHVKGLIDHLPAVGNGRACVAEFIGKTRRHLRGHKAFLDARRRATFWPTYQELLLIVHDWVESVKEISERDLRLMDRLVGAQNKLKVAA